MPRKYSRMDEKPARICRIDFQSAKHPSAGSSGLTGRSSMPATAAPKSMGLGALDAPPEPVIRRRFAPTRWRVMTKETESTFSRTRFVENTGKQSDQALTQLPVLLERRCRSRALYNWLEAAQHTLQGAEIQTYGLIA